MAKIRQEINILDGSWTPSTGSNVIPNARFQLDTTQYSGSVTYYLELLYTSDTNGSNGAVVGLRNITTSTNISGSCDISRNQTSPVRIRSASFTPTSGSNTYTLVDSSHTVDECNYTIKAARVIILQDTGSDPLTATETQIEVGNQQTGNANTTIAALTNPKYWYYDSSKWDGVCTFYAECTNFQTGSGVITIKLQEDNGSFGSWTDKVTIVNAATPASITRTRSASFTPTSGRNYRIAGFVANSMDTWEIYNAKIIVQQTSATAITKLEPQYLLANTAVGATTGLQDFDTYFDPAEWDGVTNTYYHEANNVSAGTSDARLEDPLAVSIEARGQSFVPATGSLNQIDLNLKKSGSPTGTLTLSVYSGAPETGTLLGSATKSESSLSTSATWEAFTFSPAVSVTSGTTYYMILRRSGAYDTSNTITWNGANSSVYANGTAYSCSVGTWSTVASDYGFKTYLSSVLDVSQTDVSNEFSVFYGWGAPVNSAIANIIERERSGSLTMPPTAVTIDVNQTGT